jgi:hypothetical protein
VKRPPATAAFPAPSVPSRSVNTGKNILSAKPCVWVTARTHSFPRLKRQNHNIVWHRSKYAFRRRRSTSNVPSDRLLRFIDDPELMIWMLFIGCGPASVRSVGLRRGASELRPRPTLPVRRGGRRAGTRRKVVAPSPADVPASPEDRFRVEGAIAGSASRSKPATHLGFYPGIDRAEAAPLISPATLSHGTGRAPSTAGGSGLSGPVPIRCWGG